MTPQIKDRSLTINGRKFFINASSEIILTFTVQGTCFPARRSNNSEGRAWFTSNNSIPNKIFIDYADGTGEHEYDFKSSGANRRIYFTNRAMQTTPGTVPGTTVYDQNPLHFYQDLVDAGMINTVNNDYAQQRTLKIRFEKPQEINSISIVASRLYAVFPSAISRLQGLTDLVLSGTVFLQFFPADLYNSSLKRVILNNAGDLLKDGIPMWMVNSPLELLNVNSSADLSGDPDEKGLSHINLLAPTLTTLNLADTKIDQKLPDSFGELSFLTNLIIGGNQDPGFELHDNLAGNTSMTTLNLNGARLPFSEIERYITDFPAINSIDISNCAYNADETLTGPDTKIKTVFIGWNNLWNNRTVPTFISQLTALETLQMNYPQADNSLNDQLRHYGDFSACTNLKTINISQQSGFDTTLPAWFSALTQLKTFRSAGAFLTLARINAYVDNLYAFIAANASKVSGNTAFRQMTIDTYGVSTVIQAQIFRPSGTFQQPSGYVAGTSNGSPASQMEKIWVMVNQYGHTWVYKP